MSSWSCACGFDPATVEPRFSTGWHRAYRDHHVDTFPETDRVSRANLESFIVWAERVAS